MSQRIETRDAPRNLTSTGRRGGFTLIELVIVIVIAGIIMTFAIPRFQGVQAERTARNARDVFAWTAQRARARAIQTGATQMLQLNPATERAWIVRRNLQTDTTLTIDFANQYETTVSTIGNSLITICFGPRGYAFAWGTGCSVTPTANLDVTFKRGLYESTARIKPLGQVERL